jgi:toxin ParE1/3/4
MTARAVVDISDLYRYGIDKFGRGQAVRFLNDLRKTFTLLAEHPRLGRLASSIRDGVRRHEHGSQVIVYEETMDGILILAVVHASSVKRLEL